MGVKNAFLGRLLASSDKFSDEQVAQTINLLVEHAITHEASDIHIEPHERYVQVRYRIDNVLKSVHKLPITALPAVAAQLKESCHLSSDLDHLPQEGQYATLVGEEQFEIQLYTMPVIGGEKLVLHISRRLTQPPGLQMIGFWGAGLQALKQAISASNGLVLVASPRRNGKTTTLHSMLQTINNPAISIATVEDSLEYRLPGASQTITRPKHGVSMREGLRAALNQDPNVIMLSNLPDRQTVQGAVHAAVGGHLVFAGIHADNASSALARVQAMNEEALLFAHAVRAAVSQRLVRHLCGSCRQLYIPTRDEAVEIEKTFGIHSPAARQHVHQLEKQAFQAGIGDRHLSTNAHGIAQLWRPSEDGCESCNHTGFRGTVAIVEVLATHNNETQTALLTATTATKLRRTAIKEHFIPMELDGLIKVLRGQTTATELLRTLSI